MLEKVSQTVLMIFFQQGSYILYYIKAGATGRLLVLPYEVGKSVFEGAGADKRVGRYGLRQVGLSVKNSCQQQRCKKDGVGENSFHHHGVLLEKETQLHRKISNKV
jgi:hypothetical protein